MKTRNSRLEFQALFTHMAKEHDVNLLQDELNQLEIVAVRNASTERLQAELQAREQLKQAIEKACKEEGVFVGHFFEVRTGRTVEMIPTVPSAEMAKHTCPFWAGAIAKHLPEDNTQVAVWQRVVKQGQIEGWVGFVHSQTESNES